MKHKVETMLGTEKCGLFEKRKVLVERTIEVDSKTCRKMQKEKKNYLYSIEEIILYDEIFNEQVGILGFLANSQEIC